SHPGVGTMPGQSTRCERDQVETNRRTPQGTPIGRQGFAGSTQTFALLDTYRLQRRGQACSKLDLYDRQHGPAMRQEIDLAVRCLQPEAEDAVAFEHQPQGGGDLAAAAGAAGREAPRLAVRAAHSASAFPASALRSIARR